MNIRRKLILSSFLFISSAWPETAVLKNFTLIDGSGAPPQANSAMVIVDGRVSWVGPAADLKAPAGAQTTDLAGKFVMPGIINLHGHVGNTIDLAQDPKNFTRANVESKLKMYAGYGVTSMVSMGSEQPLILDMRAEQRRSDRPAMTRIFTARRGFTGPGGYPTTVQGMKGVPYEVSTGPRSRKMSRNSPRKKVDIVKIWVDDHLGREKKIPLDLSKAIIENAHKSQLKVAAHVFYLVRRQGVWSKRGWTAWRTAFATNRWTTR